MNKKERLLADTLGDDGEHFSRLAAAHARRRRGARLVGMGAGLACGLVGALFLTRPPAVQPPLVPVAVTPAPIFEVISDQELLAQLKDLPVLIMKDRTGITGVVFLANQADPKL